MKSFNYYNVKTRLYTSGECLCSKSIYLFSDIQEFLTTLKTEGIPEPKYIVMGSYEQEEKFVDYMNGLQGRESDSIIHVGEITDVYGLKVVRMYDLYKIYNEKQVRNIQK